MFCRHKGSLQAIRGSLALIVGLSLLGLPVSHARGTPTDPTVLPEVAAVRQPGPATRAQIAETFRGLPLRFEANQGQTDPQVDFIARGSGYTMFLTPREVVLLLNQAAARGRSPSQLAVLRLQLVASDARSQGVGLNELPGKVNYLLGDDPAQWRTNIPSYAQVRYREVYPGIDLVYHGTQRQLEYDVIVRPGGDPTRIALAVEGAEKIEIEPEGDLLLHLADGMIRHKKPVIYQDVGGLQREVAGGYVLKGARQVGFAVAAYDRSRPLVIDPVLYYSTFLGGVDDDDAGGIAVDADGFAYITGGTKSANFPATGGVVQATPAGLTDAFVAKLDPAGSALVYSTYLGGSGDENGRDIAIDAGGNAYVVGETASTNFPTTAGAFQATHTGTTVVAFVTKLNATGSALMYSTYLGGTTDDEGRSIAVDANGNAYVAGETASPDFPTTAGAFRTTLPGVTAAFVTKLNPTGSGLAYSTFFGGTGADDARAITVDSAGYAYVTGETGSADLPVTAGAFQGARAGTALDAYVLKLNLDGSAPVYATYLGGTGPDRGFTIAVDGLAAPNVYVAGRTASTDFPTTPGAFQQSRAGNGPTTDTFVTKVDPNGAALVYSTYLGGGGNEEALSVALDAAGHAYVTGFTESSDFPTVAALQAISGGRRDVFVTKLSPNGAALVYSTYLGGAANDTGFGITVDAAGSAYVIAETLSTGFPATAGAFDTTFNGIEDAAVVKIADFGPATTLALAPSAANTTVNTQHCVTATVQDAAGRQVHGVTVRFAVTGAHSVSGAVRTDANGQVAFCYTGTNVGDDTIAAFADTNNNSAHNPGEPGSTATKTWVPGPPATLTLAPNAATNPVNTQHCVAATVRDAPGNPVAGVSVSFSVTGSVTAVGAAATDASGQATFCYMGPPQPGTDTVAAFADTNSSGVQDAGEPGGTATKTWAGPPATVALAPSAATNLVNTQHCVTATVGDTAGTPLSGVTVRFTVTGSVTAVGAATTNASGQATFCYAGPSVQGSDTIAAFADTNNSGVQDADEPGGTAAKTWAVPAALTLAPSAATNPINTQHCVTATVGDASGTPIPGVTVYFAVAGSVTAAGAATTTGNGQAVFCYAGPSVQGSDTITAFADTNNSGVQDAGEPGNTATKTWNPPAALTLAPSAATNLVNTQHCVTATVEDTSGTPVPGVTVRFTVTGSVTAAGSAATSGNGQAAFCYTGPSVQGNDTIAAFADTNGSGAQDPDEPGGTAAKTWAVPAALTLAPTAATNLVNTQHCVTATVADAAGTPIPGVTGRFSVTGSVTAAGAATTDAGGQAEFCYIGPPVQGNDTIAAFADTNNSGAQDPDEPANTAAKTWVAPASLALAPSTATNPVNTQHCVTATVGDAAGNPIPGVTAQFAVTGSVTAAGSAVTSGNGQATFCYTGPSVQGSDTITAFADTNNSGAQDAGEPGTMAAKRWAVPAGCGPIPGINELANRLYVANSCADTVSVIDGASESVIATVTVGAGPIAVGVNELANRIYVANYANGAGNTVSVIDGATASVVATVPVGQGPVAVEINEITNRIYVANSNGTVSVIDGATASVVATVPVGPEPVAIGINERRNVNRIYVVNSNGTVSVIDGAATAVVATLPVGAGPVAVEVSERTNRIYVANYGGGLGNTVSVIDGATNAVVATVTVGPGPFAVRIIELADRVYVANYDSGFGSAVSVIDGATNAVVATVPVGQGPAGLGINTVTNRIYAASDNGTVSVIDAASNAVMATVTTGQRPTGLEINEDTNRVYVTNSNGTVSVIDGATNAVIATVPVGPGSMGAGAGSSTGNT